MAAISGRKLRIKRGSTAIAGARSDSITINNEPIDITDKDDAGWRTMLADVGVRSIDCEVEGILTDSTFLALAVGTASALLEAYTIEVDGIGDFTGNFYLASFAVTGEQADATTFTASIQSSGTITFTPD
jgi:TP901-1 family phage major tail protein